jgi:hypothetical protein
VLHVPSSESTFINQNVAWGVKEAEISSCSMKVKEKSCFWSFVLPWQATRFLPSFASPESGEARQATGGCHCENVHGMR